jgi:hypothetical protein
MNKTNENGGFKSWKLALAENILAPEQMAVLEEMVRSGQSATIQDAANMLDWQDSIIQPDEHMYGF